MGEFNRLLQEHFNPQSASKKQLTIGAPNQGNLFRVGDRVMQVRLAVHSTACQVARQARLQAVVFLQTALTHGLPAISSWQPMLQVAHSVHVTTCCTDQALARSQP